MNLLNGLNIDERFTRTDSAGTRYFLEDGIGSTVALADASATLQTQYTYEAFGKATSSGAASTNPCRFTGREDDGTGVYYYRARYYNTTLQRFISEDPLGLRGGDANLYKYVGDDPIDFTDPFGLGRPVLSGI